MIRPMRLRHVRFRPGVNYYKPRGVPMRHLSEVVLRIDEVEAIRLKYEEGLDQVVAAKRMKISQSTFHRILNSANRKIARALISGKAIRIEGGPVKMVGRRGCYLK